ncbi:23S rRNA pseudouridine synthase F [Shewanella colwelliana]|uniref:Pseudouridine synthase n=1 Tax=Shewanella colwelliana TaxID=23 RepID=A0A1E5IUJ5_SHECO|nr:RNA pseudouridine synthase [Shewanella colwelliana]OEG74210.1 23S rRNA pseudouridine synthase F [Shewanella colwelliana]
MRLAQYIALTGHCSRRAATRLIRDGRVTIAGRIANHIDQINLSLTTQELQPCAALNIMVDGLPLGPIETKQYWMLHKKVGTDCRLLAHDPTSLIHLLPKQPRLYPVGRLDKDSRGLLLLTNDGALTQSLMHPDFHHRKYYQVQVARAFDDTFLQQMAAGVSYKDVTTLPCKITRLSTDRFEIVLTQGLNRQIRRMSQALGFKVIDLKRIAIESLQLGNLTEGELRPLTYAEESSLKGLIKHQT